MHELKINELKKLIIELSYKSQEGHIASAFSIMDILWVLYDKVLNITPENINSKKRDIFILSKGHASMALYSILYNKGFFPLEKLKTFCNYDSSFGGHPDKLKIPGIESSTGSLGHGLPFAIGAAMSRRIRKKISKIIVLVGDGELNEGSNWESMLLASHHRLNNLTCIIDYNHSTDRALSMDNIADKFNSFGWDTSVIDGHDSNQIYTAFIKRSSDKPYAIIAKTIKGKGCDKMENNPEWHHKAPNEKEYKEFLRELS